MILLIDIGNSRLKWALWDGAELSPAVAIVHDGDPAAALRRMPKRQVSAVWVAHVVGVGNEAAIQESVWACFGRNAYFARSRSEHLGLKCGYADASRLGVDRWLMMLAAWREVRGACCVVSAGTALTFDAVDASGQHQGGFIAPGLSAMLRSTLGSTRFATFDLTGAYHQGLGRDTEACVRQGAFLAALGAIQQGLRAAGAPSQQFICGGDAADFLPHLPGWQHRDNLVLQGLCAYAMHAHDGTHT